MSENLANIAFKDFHELWEKAKKHSDYSEREWMCMYGFLLQLIPFKPFKP